MSDKSEKTIKELLDFAKANRLVEMVYQENGLKVSFRRTSNASLSVPSSDANLPSESVVMPMEPQEAFIKSPVVGTFRRGSQKDRPPFVMEGGKIKPGDRVGLVESMKIKTDVVSFCEGVITKILVEDGQAVEYGQPLIAVRPNNSSELQSQG